MKRLVTALTAVVLVFCLSLPSFAAAVPDEQTDNDKNRISIMFTGDMHSHLDEHHGQGGFARLKTKTDEINQKYPESFFFDSGDFSMGTLFQTIFQSDASELIMMGELGYDVTTLGNHEFDYGAEGLAKMLQKASKNIETITEITRTYDPETYTYSTVTTQRQSMPTLVSANIDWDKTLAGKKTKEDGEKLKKAMDKYGAQDYTVIQKQGISVAVFGIMGEDSISMMPESGVKWKDRISRAKEIVNEIKRNGEADMIVCLSHGGYYESLGKDSEDIELAKEVEDIDLIISGHSHEATETPIKEGDTVIVAAGMDARNLGHIVLKKTGDEYDVDSYRLNSLNSNVEEDYSIKMLIDSYKSRVNYKYLADYGFTYNEVLAENEYDFSSIDEFVKNYGEDTLADLMTDSYIYAVKEAEGDDYEKVDVAVLPSGIVRASLEKGKITTADAFALSAVGMGADGTPGYPLVSVYLTGKELKSLVEVDASASDAEDGTILHFAGVSYSVNKHRIILNRATDIELYTEDGKKQEIEKGRLYRVVTDLYSCQMLGLVDKKSHGLLSVMPKDKSGKKIKNYEEHIIKDGGEEVKVWYAAASYIDSFKNGKVPEEYSKTQGREVTDNTFYPFALIKQPNTVGLMLIGVILIPVVIIAGLIIALRKRIIRRRGYNKSIFKKKTRRRDRPKMKMRKMNISRSSRWSRRKRY